MSLKRRENIVGCMHDAVTLQPGSLHCPADRQKQRTIERSHLSSTQGWLVVYIVEYIEVLRWLYMYVHRRYLHHTSKIAFTGIY